MEAQDDKLVIYVAARQQQPAKELRKLLQDNGYIVNSRWIDATAYANDESKKPAIRQDAAIACVEDVEQCDVVIMITEPDHPGKGGRHFESGLGFGLSKVIIYLGVYENVFAHHPEITVCATEEDVLHELRALEKDRKWIDEAVK